MARGRPKTKNGARVTIYLSFEAISKLKTLTGNRSRFLENYILSKFREQHEGSEEERKKMPIQFNN